MRKSFSPAWGGLVGKQGAQGTWGAWVQGQELLLQFPFLLPSINQDVDASRSEWEGITPSSVIFLRFHPFSQFCIEVGPFP